MTGTGLPPTSPEGGGGAVTDAAVVSHAIAVWTGWRRSPWPLRDDEALVRRFGDAASDLVPVVRALHRDFFSSRAFAVAATVEAMGELASEEFRARHPEIGDEAVRALAWSYTFRYR